MIPFSGYQEDIYAVDEPCRLPGEHARLIGEALRPGETIRHLLICPIWDSSTKPFGIQAPRASHAFCLTDTRLIVSRDYHRRRVRPTVCSIEQDSLIGLEFGAALLMSWLALYVRRSGTITQEGFYFPQHGNHHVAALLRSWREGWPVHQRVSEERHALAQSEVFKAAGCFHEHLLRLLLLPGETCRRACRRPPIWGTQQGWFRSWPAGLAYWGTLLLTDRAFFYIWSQPPLGKTGYVFDDNLLCFSLRALRRAECLTCWAAGVDCIRLMLAFGGEAGRELEILFPEDQAESAAQWTRDLAGLAECCSRLPDMHGR